MSITAVRHLFLKDLKCHIQGEVLEDDLSLGIYATDASVYQIKPLCVVLPKDEADVIRAIQIAGDHKISILPRGAGTSLAGQTVGRSMVLDFSKYMNKVLEVNVQDKWVRVQPGMARDDLNAILKPYHLHFAPDPATSSRANIGGMIGNNSSGTKSILYGKTVDNLLELKIVLADKTVMNLKELSPEEYAEKIKLTDREGEIYRQFEQVIKPNKKAIEAAFPKVMRRVQGYNLDEFVSTDRWNLSKIICGSEGTLATILEAKLKLESLPRLKSVCVVHFDQVLDAIEAVNTMLAFNPAAIEILDRTVIELSRKNLITRRSCHFIEGHPAAIQIVEFYGERAEDVLERPAEMIAQLKQKGLGYAYPVFPEGPSYEDVWLIRKKGLGLMLGLKGAKKPLAFIEDSGIPTKYLSQYIAEVLEICRQNQTQAAMYAHASVGVIHVRPILDLRDAEDIKRFKRISEATFQLVKKYGGSWSGEHGDGLVRSYKLKEYFGETVYQLLKAVKNLFDPENRMNPGKIVDAQEIDQNLRYGARYRDKMPQTHFYYREDGSFAEAVHMCTGVGECRKLQGGTMCPSFKATRDELHSTRGRANALRLAMSGQLKDIDLASKPLIDALDLCLSCKACKSECPSNVDMAKLKSEVWQMKHDKNGVSWRDRFIRDSAQWSGRFSGNGAAIINFVQQSHWFRYMLEKWAGIEKQRTLPNHAVQPFYRWFFRNYETPKNTKKKVVLFADTYLNYHEPHVGRAAVNLLDGLGYEVILANVGCCQRPKISNGFLKSAKQEGNLLAKKLDRFFQQGLKVVVCEPSCASALTEDLPDLIEDIHLAQAMKNQIRMVDVFLQEEMEAGNIEKMPKPRFEEIHVHGHCHQKALYGTKAMMQLLAGKSVSEIPSGCCGMAGSFGYEKEHYLLSKKIGEEILLPTVRKLNPEAAVVACGVSCRQQIAHFTGKNALHWVELF